MTCEEEDGVGFVDVVLMDVGVGVGVGLVVEDTGTQVHKRHLLGLGPVYHSVTYPTGHLHATFTQLRSEMSWHWDKSVGAPHQTRPLSSHLETLTSTNKLALDNNLRKATPQVDQRR
jgi:hypothetical protein